MMITTCLSKLGVFGTHNIAHKLKNIVGDYIVKNIVEITGSALHFLYKFQHKNVL